MTFPVPPRNHLKGQLCLKKILKIRIFMLWKVTKIPFSFIYARIWNASKNSHILL